MNRSRRALARIPLTASVYPCIPEVGARHHRPVVLRTTGTPETPWSSQSGHRAGSSSLRAQRHPLSVKSLSAKALRTWGQSCP